MTKIIADVKMQIWDKSLIIYIVS